MYWRLEKWRDESQDGASMLSERARYGASGAILRRLCGIDSLVGPLAVIDANACLDWRLGAVGPESNTFIEEIGPYDAWSLVASPQNPLAPTPLEIRDIASSDVKQAADQLLSAWRSEKFLRRRRSVGANDRVALVLRPECAAKDSRRGGNIWRTLYCRETGDRLNDLSNEYVDALQRAEAILGAPIEARFEGEQLREARPVNARPKALIAIAVRFAEEQRISRKEAICAIRPDGLEDLLHPSIISSAQRDVLARGLAASPGAAVGKLCFTAEQVDRCVQEEAPAILVRVETDPDDVQAMKKSVGVATTRGGSTSHAAVMARGLGLPCCVGASGLTIDVEGGELRANDGRCIGIGEWITLDGGGGEILIGALETQPASFDGPVATLMAWADEFRRLRIRVNADTPEEVETAAAMGIDGVGLCRTEHMFFGEARLPAMREMIMADTAAERRAALAKLTPIQRTDLAAFFRAVDSVSQSGSPPPVTIRLLDPPLHEFLPQNEHGLQMLANVMSAPIETLRKRARDLAEVNPMLGKRGCRIGVAFPEIYEMQARAIFEAALDIKLETGRAPRPDIMIPLVTAVREMEEIKERIEAIAEKVKNEHGDMVAFGVGIMVETPRAALRARQLGALSSFFSFGTNDLTQMTYGLSRDDAGRLMRDYVARGVFEADPFDSLDREGVGELILMAVERGRKANPSLALGLCGEHGGDPATVQFCEEAGLDYVSCSPYRTPIARLAAAQAALRAS